MDESHSFPEKSGPSPEPAVAPDDWTALVARLRASLGTLRTEIARQGDATMARWRPGIMRPGFAVSAHNLADWLALRRTDLTALQPDLARLGLSSLGRLEGHVRPSIEAVHATLSVLAGEGGVQYPGAAGFLDGPARLGRNRDQIFGEGSGGPETRIMVTLPTEAALDGGLVRQLAEAGADCFRINCAHDGPGIWGAMIGHIRTAEAAIGRRLPVSMDLGGPKFRIASVRQAKGSAASDRLQKGDRFALVAQGADHAPQHLSATLSHPALFDALQVGAEISVDDGKLRARVESLGKGQADLVVTHAPHKGMRLKPEKGVNLPGADIRVAALTAEDLAALDFVVRHADIVAYSFVQTVEDVSALQAAMAVHASQGAMPAMLLKVETPRALQNLPELVVAAGSRLPVAVMIARGDLAVEIGLARLSEIQEEILWLCEAAHVPVVWATQVLEGLVKEGQASRAEVTDAAMGQRADCVMLNKGPHIVEGVSFLRGILARMDRHQRKKSARLGPLSLWR